MHRGSHTFEHFTHAAVGMPVSGALHFARRPIDQSLEHNSEACRQHFDCARYQNIAHTILHAERVTAIECGNGATLCEM